MSPRELPELDCATCGECCGHVGTPPFTRGICGPDPHWEALPDHLRQEILAAEKRNGGDDARIPNFPCIWFDERPGLCRHYEWRPGPCRDFKVGGDDCLTHRRGMLF